MTRFLVYSSALHGLVLGSIFFFLSWSEPPQIYYGFQFMGGQSGFGTGKLEPAPAPAKSSGTPAPEKEVLPTSEDTSRVAIAKKSEPKKETPKKKSKETTQAKSGGQGKAALGHGDFQGSKTGPVGGVGTSLEIGGFGPGGGGSSANSFPFKWYGELVYKRLWEAWDRTDAGTSECKVSFKILKDGKAAEIKIKASSGDSLFDMNAKRAVLSASPFPPLPEGFKEKNLPILVRFRLQ